MKHPTAIAGKPRVPTVANPIALPAGTTVSGINEFCGNDIPQSTEWSHAVLAPDRRENEEYHAKIDLINAGGPVTVRTGPCPSCRTNHARCNHRTVPAILGVGETSRQAAEDLLRRLNRQKHTVEDRWHRDKVEAAIADLRTFLDAAGGDTLASPEPG